MVKHISKWKALNESGNKKPGRPKKEDKLVKISIMLTQEQNAYINRRAKINYSTISDEARAIFDHEMENYPDELIIDFRENALNEYKAKLENIKKIFYEDREHRILIAQSMMNAFFENHAEPIKDMFIHAHLENVQKRTGLEPETIEDLFNNTRKTIYELALQQLNKK